MMEDINDTCDNCGLEFEESELDAEGLCAICRAEANEINLDEEDEEPEEKEEEEEEAV